MDLPAKLPKLKTSPWVTVGSAFDLGVTLCNLEKDMETCIEISLLMFAWAKGDVDRIEVLNRLFDMMEDEWTPDEIDRALCKKR